MTSWGSYPKIYNLGHAYIRDLFKEPVEITEKVDGSQFSFGIIDGELKCRSRGKILVLDEPEKMFIEGVEAVRSLDLREGWTYRGEYLKKPKHNSLSYDRIPKKHVILFDINIEEQTYLTHDRIREEADRLDLEYVPLVYHGMVEDIESLKSHLNYTSVLGGNKVEGIVMKNYSRFGLDGKVLMGKLVSEEFREVHKKEWKKTNPTKGDVIEMLGEKYRNQSRWMKAIHHLRDSGDLEESHQDIGKLLKEIKNDVMEECAEEIKDSLWKYAWPNISRKITAGFPEWYKEYLIGKQFGKEEFDEGQDS